jgi:hypothetical protein
MSKFTQGDYVSEASFDVGDRVRISNPEMGEFEGVITSGPMSVDEAGVNPRPGGWAGDRDATVYMVDIDDEGQEPISESNLAKISMSSPFAGAARKPVTKKHQLAIWENMLGTVYARSPRGEVRYFDYKWDEAREFAEIKSGDDLRLDRAKRVSYTGDTRNPRFGQICLFVKREPSDTESESS